MQDFVTSYWQLGAILYRSGGADKVAEDKLISALMVAYGNAVGPRAYGGTVIQHRTGVVGVRERDPMHHKILVLHRAEGRQL